MRPPSTAAPNPWIAADGSLCRGYATREAMPGDYCARWDSDLNVRAADAKLVEEMLTDFPPFCRSDAGALLPCPVYADRTTRAGVDELDEVQRPDRRFYCQTPLFRQHFVETEFMGELRAARSSRAARTSAAPSCARSARRSAPRRG